MEDAAAQFVGRGSKRIDRTDDIVHQVVNVVTSLGYPVYILIILGIWKIPGAIALVVPGFLRLKEWAYAGIVFELSGAAVSQAVRGHGSDIIAPLVLLGLALASWTLRPPGRTLGAVSAARAGG